MRTTLAGPDGTTRAGQARNCSADEAEQLVAGRYAEYDGKPPKKSTARRAGKAVETATVNTNSVDRRSAATENAADAKQRSV